MKKSKKINQGLRALQELEGILKDKAPKHWLGMDADEIIEEAKNAYFNHRKRLDKDFR